jgi:pimeloyl-ACP methyl ester carboxylesterase
MADDVVGLLDHLSMPKAHVLGLSIGAMIAQSLAVRHPNRVDRLVLTGAAAAPARAGFDPIQVWSWLKARDADGGVFATEQFVWLFSTSFLRNKGGVDATVASLQSNPNPVTPEAYARQASAYGKFDMLGRLGSVKAKTLVITGEQDLLTPPWLGRELAAAIPDAHFELVSGDGASHVLPLERPGDCNRLVVNFLRQ